MSPLIFTHVARCCTFSTLGMRASSIRLRHPLHCAAHAAACISSWKGPMCSSHAATRVFVDHFDLGAQSAAEAAV